jgi:thioredoxin reductase
MAVETPARIAILGAGPIGLEAALYARYLGYDVDLYERGQICEHLLHWGHAQLFTLFAANSSPLGIAAISAQDSVWKPPASDALISGREFVERYCLPLARSDLLADSVHEGLEVLGVGRGDLLKGEFAGEERAEADFRLLVRPVAGEHESAAEKVAAADVVIDATGTYGQHNWFGRGGLPALGELAAAPQIEYGLPDVLGRERQHYAHRHTLLIGENHEAAISAISLTRLGHEAPYTRITWIVRGDNQTNSGPIQRIDNDPWPARDQLARSANQLIRGEIGHLSFWPGTAVESVVGHGAGEPFRVRLAGQHSEEIEVDRIIANVGYRPNAQIYSELQVEEDPMNGAPTRWLYDQQPQALVTPEPDFYVLGAKIAGRDARFTIADGLNQIRQLFTIIGDRPDLDLYSSQGPEARGQI